MRLLARRSSVPVAAPAGPAPGPVGASVPSPEEEAAGPALLVTADDRLRAEVGRLAAAAALRIHVVGEADAALRRWADTAVVLVGPDLAAPLAETRPPARPEVHVLTVATGPASTETSETEPAVADHAVYRDALALGAQSVVELPRARDWLADLLADLAEGRARHARTVAVVGGSGGAGASVLAAALAEVASRDVSTTLVDLDPGGGGGDLLLGLDEEEGLRWGRLADVQGRLSWRALRTALPGGEMLRVLAWDHGADLPAALPSAAVVHEVVTATQRGSDVVVLDVPRDLEREAVARAVRTADLVVVCARTAVLPVAAAGRVVTRLRGLGVPVGLVVRTGTGSLDPLDVADALGLPLLAEVATRRRTEELLDLGVGPAGASRSSLSRAARLVLDAVSARAAV